MLRKVLLWQQPTSLDALNELAGIFFFSCGLETKIAKKIIEQSLCISFINISSLQYVAKLETYSNKRNNCGSLNSERSIITLMNSNSDCL